jgi:ABC-type glycerol-3-phosphate transport system permease component
MKENKSIINTVYNIFLYGVFGLFTLLCVFPFYYIFINTISANDLVSTGKIIFLPRGVHFDNYVRIVQLRGLPMALFITLSRTVLGSLLSVICTAFVGYAISRQELWHRKFVYRFFIITMYFNAGLIPWFINMQRLHLTNNFLAYIIGVINPFNLILIKTYIENIPGSLEESAEIEGAGYLHIFTQIMLPLCKPILATIAIFTAVGHWNSFVDTLILMRDSRLYTLQFLLWQYLNESNAVARAMQGITGQSGFLLNPAVQLTPTAVKMTIAMVVTLPILFVYPMFQKYFIKGLMVGAIKG